MPPEDEESAGGPGLRGARRFHHDKSSEGEDNSGGDEPPPVEPKSGGCGCRVPGKSTTSGLEWTLALALGAAFAARRRRA